MTVTGGAGIVPGTVVCLVFLVVINIHIQLYTYKTFTRQLVL